MHVVFNQAYCQSKKYIYSRGLTENKKQHMRHHAVTSNYNILLNDGNLRQAEVFRNTIKAGMQSNQKYLTLF